jgi:hypothetical protein
MPDSAPATTVVAPIVLAQALASPFGMAAVAALFAVLSAPVPVWVVFGGVVLVNSYWLGWRVAWRVSYDGDCLRWRTALGRGSMPMADLRRFARTPYQPKGTIGLGRFYGVEHKSPVVLIDRPMRQFVNGLCAVAPQLRVGKI